MTLYLDTNVILARFAPMEPSHREAKELYQKIEDGKLEAVTSSLTLIEVVSTTGRAYDRYRTAEDMSREEVTGAYLKRVAATPNLSIIPFSGEITLDIEGIQVKFPALYAVAIEVAAKTGVKTLDSIHVASASIASRIYGDRVDYLVTLDKDILRRRSEIHGLTGIKAVSPGELEANQKNIHQ